MAGDRVHAAAIRGVDRGMSPRRQGRRRAAQPLRGTGAHRRVAVSPAARRTACGRPCYDSSVTRPATRPASPVSAIPSNRICSTSGFSARTSCRHEVCECSTSCRSLPSRSERRHGAVPADRAARSTGDPSRHNEHVHVGAAVGVTSGHRSEQPGTKKVGPGRQALAQSPDELASQPSQGQHRPAARWLRFSTTIDDRPAAVSPRARSGWVLDHHARVPGATPAADASGAASRVAPDVPAPATARPSRPAPHQEPGLQDPCPLP